MAGGVRFEGTGPFYLRTVERAKANALDGTIQLTLFAVVEQPEEVLVQIETQMTFAAAEELANMLIHALDRTVDKQHFGSGPIAGNNHFSHSSEEGHS